MSDGRIKFDGGTGHLGGIEDAAKVVESGNRPDVDPDLGIGIAIPSGDSGNYTASATVKAGAGRLLGFYVNSTTAGTLVVRDGTTDSDPAKTGTITPVIGWHWLPLRFTTGLRFTIGATLNITPVFL